MAEYRLYTLTAFNSISRPAEIIECDGDSEAIEKATQLLDGHLIEVWEGTRVVVRLDPHEGTNETSAANNSLGTG